MRSFDEFNQRYPRLYQIKIQKWAEDELSRNKPKGNYTVSVGYCSDKSYNEKTWFYH